MYYFDLQGFLTDTVNPERSTAIPPKQETLPEGVKWNFTGYEWIALSTEVPEVPAAEPDQRLWWIDVGPFYDRFGPDALAIAASDNGACKAVQTLTSVRKYIDLKDPKVSQMIDMLIALQQPSVQAWAPGSGPMTPQKKAVILDTPTTEIERHIKGL